MPPTRLAAPRPRRRATFGVLAAVQSPVTRRPRRRLIGAAAATLALAALAPTTAAAAVGTCPETTWVGSWSAAPSDTGGSMENRTLRVIVKAHRAGERAKVRLTNRFGSKPMKVLAVTVSEVDLGSRIKDNSTRPVWFGTSREVTVTSDVDAVSSPLDFRIASAFSSVAIDVYFKDEIPKPTRHKTGLQTSYSTKNGLGNHTGKWTTTSTGTNPFAETHESWYLVRGLDVEVPGHHGSVVAFGDSLSDGTGSQKDVDERYPDWLQRHLNAQNRPFTAVNAGIGGNMILQDGLLDYAGESMKKRVLRDVIAQPGVTDVVLLGGANDMGQPNLEFGRFATDSDVINGLIEITTTLHAAGLNVILATIPPTGEAWVASYGDFWMGNERRSVNQWIRTWAGAHDPAVAWTAGLPDGVWDLSEAVRDSRDFAQLSHQRAGDHVHPNGLGYKVWMNREAGLGTLGLLRGPACARG